MTRLLTQDQLLRTSGDAEALRLPPVRLVPRITWAVCPTAGVPVARWVVEAEAGPTLLD